MNQLFCGDNLDVLRQHIKDASVDLVYLDPPFNSHQDYNVLCAEQEGSRSAAQIKAFEDTWRWDQVAAKGITIERDEEKEAMMYELTQLALDDIKSAGGQIPVPVMAWYHNVEPTFADCLALVRQHLWRARHLVNSGAEPEFVQCPRAALELLRTGLPLAASLAKAESDRDTIGWVGSVTEPSRLRTHRKTPQGDV